MSDAQIFHDSRSGPGARAQVVRGPGRDLRLLLLWTVICLFPIYWTITTSFKMAPDVMQGNMIPWVDFTPKWLGWRSLGLSPDTIGNESHRARRIHEAVHQFSVVSLSASALAVILGVSPPTGCRGSATSSASCATRTSRSSSSAS